MFLSLCFLFFLFRHTLAFIPVSKLINLHKCNSRLLVGFPTQDDNKDKEAFINKQAKKWRGSTETLKRRGQIPDKKYTPSDVCRIILSALQSNDDPQLDHGACVVLEFATPNGPLSNSGLDPGEYGHFLREEYSEIIDFKEAVFLGEPEEMGDSLQVKQNVKVVQFGDSFAIYGIYLSLYNNKWHVDVILRNK